MQPSRVLRPSDAALWAAAAGPMSILGWIVAPWLSHHLGTSEPQARALLICFNIGLLWTLALTLMVRREGGPGRAQLRDALWALCAAGSEDRPRRRQGWRLVVPFVLLAAALEALPSAPTGPVVRDFPDFIANVLDRFSPTLSVLPSRPAPGAHRRGAVLPRFLLRQVRLARERRDLHCLSPARAVGHADDPCWTGSSGQAYPAKRFRSIWISISRPTRSRAS